MLIAQISDTHVVVEPSRSDGVPTRAEALARAVAHVLALRARPDVVLVSGDCTDHGTGEETDLFRSLLAPLPMPVFVIPGNHDDRDVLRSRFGGQGAPAMDVFMQYVVDDFPVRIVALDTHVPGENTGELCAARLAWLDARLAEAPATPTLVVMHHPPFDTGMRVLDALGLANRDAFADVVARHPQVERVVAGHIHCAMQRRLAGTLAMTCPSTGLQIAIEPGDPGRLWISEEPPAILLHSWDAGAGLVSYASPVPSPPPARLLHDGANWVG